MLPRDLGNAHSFSQLPLDRDCGGFIRCLGPPQPLAFLPGPGNGLDGSPDPALNQDSQNNTIGGTSNPLDKPKLTDGTTAIDESPANVQGCTVSPSFLLQNQLTT